MNLRDYQQASHDAIFKEWETNQSTLLVIPTGGGKTVIFAHVIKSLQPKRVMVLAHRNELIVQAREKIEAVTGLPVEIEKADQYASTGLFNRTPVVVSSIQTQISGAADRRRYFRFNPLEFGALVCDEAHHALSPSWKEVIAHYCKNPALKVLGCTATPDRSDKLGLKAVFSSVAFVYGILDAIHDGWLVDITQQFIPVKSLDFSHIKTTAGDLNEGELSQLMEMEENVQGICQPTLEAMHGLKPKSLSAVPTNDWREFLIATGTKPRRTIVFTVSVEQAQMCANVFSRAMKGVEWVCGATNKDTRSDILKRFAVGETHCVCNCGVLLEGFDNPAVELISMARPTKSRSLYSQCVGRSLRPLPGIVDGLDTPELRRAAIEASPKKFARILDFVGNSGRHKLISCADILGGRVSEEAAEAAKKKALDDGTPKRILVTMENAQLELERQKREAIERLKKAEEARRAHLLAKVDYSVRSVDPFGAHTLISSPISRDGRRFSERQFKILREGGIDPRTIGYRQGQAIIGKLVQKPSPGQIKVLQKHGYEVNGLSRREASDKIDALAKNGWRRPDAGQDARLAVIGK